MVLTPILVSDGAGMDTNKAVVRRYVEWVLNEKNLDAADEVVLANVIGHEPAREIQGIKDFNLSLAAWFSAFPDFQLTTDDLFGEEDKVAWRWTLRGLHGPTGRPVTVSGIIIFRLDGGRIAEYWGHYDRLGMMRQQGLLPEVK